MDDSILAPLNEQQRAAAEHGRDPLLLIAGAGTGKTTTLVHRVARLIATGAKPWRILLLTFTRRSALEMLDRVYKILESVDESGRVWGGTFHAVGSRLLRIYAEQASLVPGFTLYDRADAESLMKAVVSDLGFREKNKSFPNRRTCLAIHSYAINAQVELNEALESRFHDYVEFEEELDEAFGEYEHRKLEANVVDYDDLLLKTLELSANAEIAESIRERFDWVLVDEYQDTNPVQGAMIRNLVPDGQGLTVVGDDAQSIYAFRAATVRNILDFPKQFKNVRKIALERNYRSTDSILHVSNQVISEAREWHKKELWTERKAESKPRLKTCFSESEQSDYVVRQIQKNVERGIALDEQAVLIRSSFNSNQFETALSRYNIPFVKYGGLRFVDSAHVKDFLALLRFVENPSDLISGQRVLGLLPGIGEKTSIRLLNWLKPDEGGFEAWKSVKPPKRASEAWGPMCDVLHRLKTDPLTLTSQLEIATDWYKPLLEANYDSPERRLMDLDSLAKIAKTTPSRRELLEDLTLDPPTVNEDEQEKARPLVISTIHSAKGLEWKVVFVISATDGTIPNHRSVAEPDQYEEERRLLYVALTRAADELHVSYLVSAPSYHRSMDHYATGGLTPFISQAARRHFDVL